MISALVGVSIWFFEDALSRSAVALDARHDAGLTQQLVGIFWHEHEAMNEYMIAPTPASMHEIGRQRVEFAATSATLGASQTLIETRLRSHATAGDNGFGALFRDSRGRGNDVGARESRPAKG